MKITNISPKIIGVGQMVLMPDATSEIDEKAALTPAVKRLVDMGMLKAEKPIEFELNEADIDTSAVTLVMPAYEEENVIEEKEEEKPAEKKPRSRSKKKAE